MRKRDLQDRAKIEAAVQKVAEEYLKDPNITSVGVGYKVVDGRPTDELALQFTVADEVRAADPRRRVHAADSGDA